MHRVGSINEWYRFLDAKSDDEAVTETLRHVARLDTIYDELRVAVSRLSYSPGGDVSETLSLGLTSLAEAMGMLESVAARFRAGERGIA